MSSKYNQNGLKTENRSSYTSQIFPHTNGNNYRLSYASESPKTNFSKIKTDKEDSTNNSTISRYSHKPNANMEQIGPKKSVYNINHYNRYTEKRESNQIPSDEKTFQTLKTNHSIYFSDFSKIKNNLEHEKKIIHRPTYTLKQPTQTKLNQKYNIHEIHYSSSSNINNKRINTYNNELKKNKYHYNNNNNYNSNKNRYSGSNINSNSYKERKTVTHTSNLNYDNDKKINAIVKKEYTNKSYQGDKYKFPPKYYRNTNSITSKNENKNNKKLTIEKKQDKYLYPVAQKICNIVIKGENTHKNENKQYDDLYTSQNSLKNKNFNNKIIPVYTNSNINKKIEYEEENDDKLHDYNNNEEDEVDGEEEEEGDEEGEEEGEGEGEVEADEQLNGEVERERDEQIGREVEREGEINVKPEGDEKIKVENDGEREGDEQIDGEEDLERDGEEYDYETNENVPKMQIQRAQSLEQLRDKKKNLNHKRKKIKRIN